MIFSGTDMYIRKVGGDGIDDDLYKSCDYKYDDRCTSYTYPHRLNHIRMTIGTVGGPLVFLFSSWDKHDI